MLRLQGFLCNAGNSSYRAARRLVSQKGKGDGDWIEMYNAKGEEAGMARTHIPTATPGPI